MFLFEIRKGKGLAFFKKGSAKTSLRDSQISGNCANVPSFTISMDGHVTSDTNDKSLCSYLITKWKNKKKNRFFFADTMLDIFRVFLRKSLTSPHVPVRFAQNGL